MADRAKTAANQRTAKTARKTAVTPRKRAQSKPRRKTLPPCPNSGVEAMQFLREANRQNTDFGVGMCAKVQRLSRGFDVGLAADAKAYWELSGDKHPIRGTVVNFIETVPYGAWVVTRSKTRPPNDDDNHWHILEVGGFNRDGVRIFRSTDIGALGEVTPCRLVDLLEKWNHIVVGYVGDAVNRFTLDLPAPPKGRH